MNKLPQINEQNIERILTELYNQNIPMEVVTEQPKKMIPIQRTVSKSKVNEFYEKIDNNEDLPHSWIDKDNNIIDGHNRNFAYKNHPDVESASYIKICLPKDEAINILNKIIDRINFEDEYAINPKTAIYGTDNNLNEIKQIESSKNIDDEIEYPNEYEKIYELYSSKEFTPRVKSAGGIFMLMRKTDTHRFKNKIQFDNLMELSSVEIQGFTPVTRCALYKLDGRFIEKDSKAEIKEMANAKGISEEQYIRELVNTLAYHQGYDGIKYDDMFIQIITPNK